ncbi:Gfo/Idh/MocA family oxidoreductase [Methanobrevibacter sp.]|uniref:Gfo/Idh/MocA family oxidoreductase n=1 Tax=Methanobrevibacter sp. TaxID=66852 RepID=UPI002E76294B|nr:Gfo/Idh/MocA family oxidoreductase [Methanobrevibacter sp.]MEE0025274.1 Gfo/Idh/MocA family oxidoreductase [Methanobrevibacter sp.]
MVKVITYGTYDLFHYGHQRLLERAKDLGDYLIVGVTADDFDKQRGKINVKQSLMERIESVRATGLADEIIIEEYEGQKIDDIKRYDVDIFTVGSDWVGHFDYLNEYCDVVYLERTEGVSSSDIRSKNRNINLGLVGEGNVLKKFYDESKYVNGITVNAASIDNEKEAKCYENEDLTVVKDYDELLPLVDAVYIISHPSKHYDQIKKALDQGKHVLCESPFALSEKESVELQKLANENDLILMDSIKTAYSTAYNRLLLLLKGGKIGDIYSVDATCTSIREYDDNSWNSITAWAPTALLPIFQILGVDYKNKTINSLMLENKDNFDLFTKIDFIYENAVASIKVANSVKSEGELIISGSEGYAYVPAPWWKTDYFEIRFENLEDNQKYFYQLDGEGIRYELVAFAKSIELNKNNAYIDGDISNAICKIMEDFENKDVNYIQKY